MGPLTGLRVIEIEGLGPAPFCGMMLADMGAEVISITRKSSSKARPAEVSERGKKSIAVNLKSAEGVEIVLKLCATADALIEGFRPGVAERLGIGPEDCMARNPKLVYGRMTGWGQTGPLSQAAGHDINYISLSGALHSIGRAGEKPVPPLNLVGDFGGGGMFLAFGLMCAIFESSRSGQGQVVDVSMVEGSAALMHMMYAWMASDRWRDERGVNLLDGASYFYDSYQTADGKYVSIGSLEPQFFQILLEKAELDASEFCSQSDESKWPELKAKLTAVMKNKTRDEWCAIMEGSDVCFAPILSMSEAPEHPHNKFRQSYLHTDGILQAAPTPKFSRTAPSVPASPPASGSNTSAVLSGLGYSSEQIAQLAEQGVLP
ncbi:CaiB/BaiF CoA-transferase family protein [uncultured Zhongshania sp.]|uniref:CaiB/BaiF CoA transferase family protein n=1 Tax=uncultured Zhongshania sp. TaxID=1642288 RepID=UPI0025EABD63|nr:CaiB/BaiF CoA-transferase family protein [uncultured Zhongshania sp.]